MSIAALDCLECRSTGSLRRGFCEICYAETGEQQPEREAAVLPPAVPAPLRFDDVISELAAITSLARGVGDAEMLAAVCARAQRLIEHLRVQFMDDLGLD